MKKILIIQTAFLGDVVLATALVEKLRKQLPEAQLHFLLRKGNEALLKGHPHLQRVLVWNKQNGKFKDLFRLLREIRQERYDLVLNLQRFGATGLLTTLSGARQTVGFDKNPFSRFFSRSVPHDVNSGLHETQRNQLLLAHLTDQQPDKPRLYPLPSDYEKVAPLKEKPYLCLAPASVWFTKQYPEAQWTDLLNKLPQHYRVYLLGAPTDKVLNERILQQVQHPDAVNLAGQLNLLQSAALMQDAVLNYVNDSGPMHLASATDAPVCAIYCSTIPGFGFGPLSTFSAVVETTEPLSCRPCGLHGYRACPEGHFRCATTIQTAQLLAVLKQAEAKQPQPENKVK